MKIEVSLKSDRNYGYFNENQTTFLFVSCSVLLKIRIFHTQVVEENKTHILHSRIFFQNHPFMVYDIMWTNIVGPGRQQMTTWHMRTACWIPKATNTHSEYVILLAFP